MTVVRLRSIKARTDFRDTRVVAPQAVAWEKLHENLARTAHDMFCNILHSKRNGAGESVLRAELRLVPRNIGARICLVCHGPNAGGLEIFGISNIISITPINAAFGNPDSKIRKSS
jgi:hypothetical protein